MEGSDVVCLEGLDRRALQGPRKPIKNRTHVRRSQGRDSNGGLPKTEHECCRLRGVVTRENTFLLFTTSRPRTSTPLNLMFNGYKSSSALERYLKTVCNSSNGTHDSHSTYNLMLRTADVNSGFCVIRNAAFHRLVYLTNAPTTLHAQRAKQLQI